MPMTTISWPQSLSGRQRQTVLDCAKWSQMAYLDTVPASSDMTSVTQVACEDCDAQCLVFDAKNVLIVAVRGTTSAEDMLCDVRVVQTLLDDIPDVLVHRGFNVQCRAIVKVIDERVVGHLRTGGELICTGHSLGAGVAALIAVSYAVKYPGQVSYFGYGSPRQGNKVFMQLMQSTTSLAIVVKNLRDPVCASIPAICMPSRYEHAGLHIAIGTDPTPHVPNIVFIQDHDIAGYVENLQATVTKSQTQSTNNNWTCLIA